MKHWILTFRPDTYELVKTHETIGVGIMHGRRFQELSEGDRFVIYVTKKALLDGHGEIAGMPFSSEEPIFGTTSTLPVPGALRRNRSCGEWGGGSVGAFRLHGQAHEDHADQLRFSQGRLMEISPDDYAWLLDLMHGKTSIAWSATRA